MWNLLNSLLLSGDDLEGHLGLHCFLQESISPLLFGAFLAIVGEVDHVFSVSGWGVFRFSLN